MSSRSRFFRIAPTILQIGVPCTVRIEPLYGHVAFPTDAALEAVVAERDTRRKHSLPVVRRGRVLEVSFTPDREQEYVILLTVTQDNETVRQEEFPLYALGPDLFRLRPWKGDLHIHSCRSDGREEPAYVAAACRRTGLDFMAVTDHRRYEPSLEARAAFKDAPVALRIYPGEEVHPPDNPVHIINFGGAKSINAMFADREKYESAVDVVEAGLDVPLEGPEKRVYASCTWVFEQIREAGGIAILCHPYWLTGDAYNVSEALQAAFYENRPFDALEVIGGFHRWEMESNALQVARWQEERARGHTMPVVGVSDAHGCERGELFGWYYSVVFAPDTDLTTLRDAVVDRRSVAVEAVKGEFPRIFGPFRLVKFAYFLLRVVFPLHDELCIEGGRSMLRLLAGDSDAVTALAKLRGRVAGLYETLWGE